jgi:hypothetical protein
VIILALLWAPSGGISAAEEDSAGDEAANIQPIEAAGPPGQTVPELIRRPMRNEVPRYPRDAVIGELGRGNAPEGAYSFARNFLSALIGRNSDSSYLSALSAALREEILQVLETIGASKYRIGGGREEEDGSTSFLFRFIGREQGAAGELYLRLEEENWMVDDILVEEPRDASGRGDAYQYDFTPYERFY